GCQAVAAQQRLEREAGTLGHLPARAVGIVGTDLHAPRSEVVERETRQRTHRLGDVALTAATSAPPVADLEAAQRPVDAVQARAAEEAALAAHHVALEDEHHQILAQ